VRTLTKGLGNKSSKTRVLLLAQAALDERREDFLTFLKKYFAFREDGVRSVAVQFFILFQSVDF
jgi:hypothetical protein